MPPTLFLHIGTHKTGTSAIQAICAANYAALVKQGCLFPQAGFKWKSRIRNDATSGHSDLLNFLKGVPDPAAERAASGLKREFDQNDCARVIISSEVLSAPHNVDAVSGIDRLRSMGFDVRIVVYLRRQDKWLDSFYRERLKWSRFRETRTVEEFWRAEGDSWLNYRKRIGPWIEAAGPGGSIVRSYEDAQQAGGVVGDFLSVVGVDGSGLDLSSQHLAHNASVPAAAAELLRAFNKLPVASTARKSELTSAVCQMEMFTAAKGSLVGEDLWNELQFAYAAQNEEIRQSWLTGPSERLSFDDGGPREPLVQPAISYADSRLLVDSIVRALENSIPDPAAAGSAQR